MRSPDQIGITLEENQLLMQQLKEKAALEYRRQHNIFEAGDWIIIDSYKPEYQFYQITKDDIGSHWINLVEFRHATDAEIKAGKRLEVNQ
mgnify:FL=1